MHAVAEIILPSGFDVVRGVAQVMDYFREEDDDGNKTDSADWWDWYRIGGRFSGRKLQARLDQAQMRNFCEELQRRNVTVSSVTCGKQTLQNRRHRYRW